jgi:hypothetical protein
MKKLPENLNDLEFSSYQSEAKTLVERNLVTYKKLETTSEIDDLYKYSNTSSNTGVRRTAISKTKKYKYEVCVVYKAASKDNDSYSTKYSYESDNDNTYISAYNHPSGRKCYTPTVSVYTTGL